MCSSLSKYQHHHVCRAQTLRVKKSPAPEKNPKYRGLQRKETVHPITTYFPSGEERPDHERACEWNINPDSSGCLASLSTPGRLAMHKGLGREWGWNCHTSAACGVAEECE